MPAINQLFQRVFSHSVPRAAAEAGAQDGTRAAMAGDRLVLGAGARQQAQSVWYLAPEDAASGESYRQVERDAYHVNAETGPKRLADAEAQVAKNAGAERQALQGMSKTEQAQYRRIAALTETDPPARLALQVLLLEGTLADRTLAPSAETLLQTLDGLATRPLPKTLDRESLTSDLIQEIAVPDAIAQRNRATCAATAAQIFMAKSQPAEYARLVSDLASEKGEATLANGDVVSRLAGTEAEDGTPRTASNRLWTGALMPYAGEMPYDNVTGTFRDGTRGLFWKPVDRLLDGLTGRDFGVMSSRFLDRNDMLNTIEEETSQGRMVPIDLDWSLPVNGVYPGAHLVNATSVTEGRVHYINPWGQEESMAADEFASRMGTLHAERPAIKRAEAVRLAREAS